MKTVKVMGIIGIVMSIFSLFCLAGWNNPYDYESAIGWGIIIALYALAYSIVGVVQGSKKKSKVDDYEIVP